MFIFLSDKIGLMTNFIDVSKLVPAEIGYIAGVIDSDGCIAMYRNNKKGTTFSTRVCIVQRNPKIVDWLLSKIGGGIAKSTVKYKGTDRVYYRWYIGAKSQILKLLTIIRAHLVNKQNQADVMISFIDRKMDGAEACSILKSLKKNP